MAADGYRMPSRSAVRRFHVRVVVGVTAAVALVVGLASTAVWYAERDAPHRNIRSFGDAVWWSMETITTVGYGDHSPTTTLGRVVAGSLMVVGLALVGVITAAVVTWVFSELDVVREMREIEQSEEQTEATLEEVLRELRGLRERFDRLDRTIGSGGREAE